MAKHCPEKKLITVEKAAFSMTFRLNNAKSPKNSFLHISETFVIKLALTPSFPFTIASAAYSSQFVMNAIKRKYYACICEDVQIKSGDGTAGFVADVICEQSPLFSLLAAILCYVQVCTCMLLILLLESLANSSLTCVSHALSPFYHVQCDMFRFGLLVVFVMLIYFILFFPPSTMMDE